MKKLKRTTTLTVLLSTLGTVGTTVLSAIPSSADEIDLSSNTTKEEFINTLGQKAQVIANEHGLYASVMIAQAIVESGWGSSTLSQAPNYNLFGIKGSYNGSSVNMATMENTTNGEGGYSTTSDFRKYSSYDESLEDNAALLSKDMYSGTWKTNTTSYKDATLALTGLYATATDYNEKLNKVIEDYNLTQYDTLNSEQTTTQVEPDYKTRTEEEITPTMYTVKDKDSLWGVARENKVSIDQLIKWNDSLKDNNSSDLTPGVELKVGETTETKEIAYQTITETNEIKHTIVSGDTLSKIASDYGITLDELLEQNPDINVNDVIYAGQEVKIKDEVTTYDKDLTDEEKTQKDNEAKEKAKLIDEEKARASATNTQTLSTSDGTSSSIDTTNMSESVKKIIALAEAQIGKPYEWGARGDSSFDCSGLTQYVYKNALGINIGSWTVPQESSGTTISVSEAQPGDLYFWGSPGGTTHVAIAIGNGQYIHAPQPGETVSIGNIQWFTPSFAVRVL